MRVKKAAGEGVGERQDPAPRPENSVSESVRVIVRIEDAGWCDSGDVEVEIENIFTR